MDKERIEYRELIRSLLEEYGLIETLSEMPFKNDKKEIDKVIKKITGKITKEEKEQILEGLSKSMATDVLIFLEVFDVHVEMKRDKKQKGGKHDIYKSR